jgi:DNA adenine methylase
MVVSSGLMTSNLKPFIKWPGGKSSELELIKFYAPTKFSRYIDPFVGGGSVFLSINHEIPAILNDASFDLIEIYKRLASEDREFNLSLKDFCTQWNELKFLVNDKDFDLIKNSDDTTKIVDKMAFDFEFNYIQNKELRNILRTMIKMNFKADMSKKLKRLKSIENKLGKKISEEDLQTTLQGVLKASFYNSLREQYNKSRKNKEISNERIIMFYLIRELCYAAMFRFNKKGEFNIPFGGNSYVDKDLLKKYSDMTSKNMINRLQNSTFSDLDYQEFLNKITIKPKDFIFIDPPYDSVFSNYDNRTFDEKNQIELENNLRKIKAQVMVLIGATDFIRDLYSNKKWNIIENPKKYVWNIKSRNDGKATHLLIKNY